MTIVKRVRVAATAMVVAGLLTAVGSSPALAEVGFGSLFLNGQVVGTVVTPAHVEAGSGRDAFYKVTNGVAGQLGIAGVGPGSPDYHGGDWEVFTVTWKPGTTRHLLTSEAAVFAAGTNVTITRVITADFRCPITAIHG